MVEVPLPVPYSYNKLVNDCTIDLKIENFCKDSFIEYLKKKDEEILFIVFAIAYVVSVKSGKYNDSLFKKTLSHIMTTVAEQMIVRKDLSDKQITFRNLKEKYKKKVELEKHQLSRFENLFNMLEEHVRNIYKKTDEKIEKKKKTFKEKVDEVVDVLKKEISVKDIIAIGTGVTAFLFMYYFVNKKYPSGRGKKTLNPFKLTVDCLREGLRLALDNKVIGYFMIFVAGLFVGSVIYTGIRIAKFVKIVIKTWKGEEI